MARKPKFVPARSLEARALFHRAGTAAVAVAVDTRPKRIPPKKGKTAYRRRGRHPEALHAG